MLYLDIFQVVFYMLKNFMKLFNKEELIEESKDKNPGTANAFMYGGMTCGI